MINLLKHINYFTSATQVEVNTIKDIPKLTTAMREFGWFASADEIDAEAAKILNLCGKEHTIVTDAQTT